MKINPERDMPFLGAEGLEAPCWEKSNVVILPLPYEQTVSYAGGTGKAPRSILEASSQVEFFDDELKAEPYECGIYTLQELNFEGIEGLSAIELIEKTASEIVDAGKFPLGLGGEHTVTIGLVKAVHKKYPDLHIVHLDAHADMRAEYGGTPWSHACVMRRLFEMGLPYTSIGIRELCMEEYESIKPRKKNYFFAHEIAKNNNWIAEALKTISGPIYLTVDVDVFDCALIPHTGTPSPGGLGWYQVAAFIRALMENNEIVGADVVELAPNTQSHASDFAIAKLVYKIIGYWWVGKNPK